MSIICFDDILASSGHMVFARFETVDVRAVFIKKEVTLTESIGVLQLEIY
jgi:hypothetical protein